ncbi:MAG: carboxypeptidase regulatory-like domain-containing protein [Deltaproteobacteria bacterium]|nr:carboxypeptidase regulatory-like domain-containing protein [Deltaproteobacteria bacterium]
MRNTLTLRGVTTILAALAAFGPVDALARNTGKITGRVVDSTDAPMVGVTVIATSPALQGEQTEFTDENGTFTITELPPGEYLVRFYFDNLWAERPGVVVRADQMLAVNITFPTQKSETKTYVITERAPTVDVGSTQVQTAITNEIVRKTPIRGRTYESVLTIAPGSTSDDVGYSFNGATGPENAYLLDGMNTTNPSYGLIGTALTLEFIEETDIITAGYSAEYGRATGGVVNVVTRSGSNEWKGEGFFYLTPFLADPKAVARLGEAVTTKRFVNDQALDVGLTLGGPLLKDHIWVFLGVHPQFASQRYVRSIQSRLANDLDPSLMEGEYAGDITSTDPLADCPEWIKAQGEELCTGGAYASRAVKGTETTLRSQAWLLNYMAKIDARINDDHKLVLQYVGSPSFFDGVASDPNDQAGNVLSSFNGDPAIMGFTQNIGVHDVLARYSAKLAERKLELDAIVGFHLETNDVVPAANGPGVNDTREVSITTYESIPACRPTVIHGVAFNPCPVSNYDYGGFGFFNDLTQSRLSGSLFATYFLQAAGTHAIKLGGDFELNRYRDRRIYTGKPFAALNEILDETTIEKQAWATIENDEVKILQDGFEGDVSSTREMIFLRDAFSPAAVPGLTVNAGLRWELEQVKDPEGETIASLSDNIAPRLGAIYDLTQKGLSKVFASYGRFYEAIPLNIADRAFAKEGLAIQDSTGACSLDARGRVDVTSCPYDEVTRDDVFGGESTPVSPGLKGQYSDEITAGLELDVGWDMVLGASFVHRNLGRVIEDISPDGGNHYFIANPGDEVDPDAVADLQAEIARLNAQISGLVEEDAIALKTEERDEKLRTLQLYQGISAFAKPERFYNAAVLTARKRFSDNFLLQASYTYSRTFGNYPGLYSPSNGQLDPNISTQYDLPELLLNREGPLPSDRPHNFKLQAAYFFPVGDKENEGLTLGVSFRALSGAPIEVLGRNPLYGALESFILPRGSGGRLPVLTSLDLSLRYTIDVVELGVEAFNVYNSRVATSVDEEYTADRVLPIPGGTLADLKTLKTTSGVAPRKNPNFGQATSYQAPFSMRLGARVRF